MISQAVVGRPVVIKGTSRMDLNGRSGTATEYDPKDGRYVVQFSDGKKVTVKKNNLAENKSVLSSVDEASRPSVDVAASPEPFEGVLEKRNRIGKWQKRYVKLDAPGLNSPLEYPVD